MQMHRLDRHAMVAASKMMGPCGRASFGPAPRRSMLSAVCKTRDTDMAAAAEAIAFLRLLELVPVVRRYFHLEPNFSDDAIMASLKSVARCPTKRARAEALRASELGRHLGRSHDLPAAMATLLALLSEIDVHD